MRVRRYSSPELASSPSLSAGHGSSKFALTPWTACCWSKISCTSVQLTGAPVAPAQLAQCWLMVPGATRAAGWGCRLAGQLRPHPPPRCSGVVRRCVCARPQPREEAAAWCLLLRTFTSMTCVLPQRFIVHSTAARRHEWATSSHSGHTRSAAFWLERAGLYWPTLPYIF